MRYIKYIAIWLAFALTSCYQDNFDVMPDGQGGGDGSGRVEIVARIIPFEQQDVTSRAVLPDNFTSEEVKVHMMDFVIFGNDGKCVFYFHLDGNNTSISLDRATAFEGMQENVTDCKVYTVANFPDIYSNVCAAAATSGKGVDVFIKENVIGQITEEFFLSIKGAVNGITLPATGLPMMGSQDGMDLSANNTSLQSGSTILVPTRSLLAKMVFNIEIDPHQVVEGVEDSNKFKIESFEVHNLATTMDATSGTVSAPGKADGTNDDTAVYTSPTVGKLSTSLTNNFLTTIPFTFYLPERFLRPATAADDYAYPFKEDGEIRPEDLDLRQRYKPMLAQDKATYVKIDGLYKNHQGHVFDVTYNIYVGNDNYGNFDIERNKQYNNDIIIHGIQNAEDQPEEDHLVAMDHRVNITRTRPMILNLRRETLLDSHYEIRPLRVRGNDYNDLYKQDVDNDDVTPAIKVEVFHLNGEDGSAEKPYWVGLERDFGDGKSSTNGDLYCTGDNVSAGKRKYFTTDLVTSALADTDGSFGADGFSDAGGHVVIVPVTETHECVWIYVDECSTSSRDIGAMRDAKLRAIYGTVNTTTGVFTPSSEYIPTDYTLRQHLLYEVVTTRDEYEEGVSTFLEEGIYHIEHEEEYLHNFDADDVFGETSYQGMAWGLNSLQLSWEYSALYLDAEPGGFLMSILESLGWSSAAGLVNGSISDYLGLDPKYDFYLLRDIETMLQSVAADKREALKEVLLKSLVVRDFAGYEFNEEIVNYLLTEYATKPEAKLNGIQLDEQPASAIAYCYNKNKRNANGEVEEIVWYLPAIGEIEDIMEKEYGSFDGVFQENKYWSCQPAYSWYQIDCQYRSRSFSFTSWSTQPNITGDCFVDNTLRARATMAERENGVFKEVISSASPPSGLVTGRFNVTEVFPASTFDNGNWTIYTPDYTPYKGNLQRTEMARVRCIRQVKVD